MTALLPEALDVQGKLLAINADFRNVLRIFSALNDPALEDAEKAFVMLRRLFRDPVPLRAAGDAVQAALWFLDGGDLPKSKESPVPVMDWQQDAHMLFPAVSRVAGVTDIRSMPFLHWWTFLGLFGEITDGLFSTVLHIRRKRAEGKRLAEWESEFFRLHKSLVLLHSQEELREIAETEDFLAKIT